MTADLAGDPGPAPPAPAEDTRRGWTVRQVAVPVLLTVVVGLFVAFVSPRPGWHGEFDLTVYRGAVVWWLEHKPLYSYHHIHTPFGFTYPPFAALTMLPWAWVNQTTAMVVNEILSGLVLIGLTWWLITPLARRHGWPRGFSVAVAVPLVYLMEPVRDTLGWGQVNLYLAALVLIDVAALTRGRAFAGVGIGLATAIKLTPGLFVVYLVLTGRWRAAGVALATFLAATLFGFGAATGTSTQFWTHELFQTSRVGHVDRINNQSLLGLLSRVAGTGERGSLLWGLLAGAVLIVGMARARQAWRSGDELAGITLTGLTACLISPISWTHHLIWVVPAILILVDIAAGTPADVPTLWRRGGFRISRALAGGAALIVAAIFGFSLVWWAAAWQAADHAGGPLVVLGINAYTLVMLALIALLPVRRNGIGHPFGEVVSTSGTVSA